MFKLLLLLIFIGFPTYLASSNYVVNTSDGIRFYPRESLGFDHLYTDLTKLSFSELKDHKQVIKAMLRANDYQYLPGGDLIQQAMDTGKSVSSTVTEFDEKYKVSSTLNEISRISSEKFQQLDKDYQLGKKLDRASAMTKEQAQRLNEWLKEQ